MSVNLVVELKRGESFYILCNTCVNYTVPQFKTVMQWIYTFYLQTYV